MPEWLADDLLDKHEASAYLGITVNTLRTHRYHPKRGTFPDPDGRKSNRDAWRRGTLDTWRADHPAPVPTTTTTETPAHG